MQLTSPVEGATFPAPASLTLAASASDTYGTVTQVAFYAGATLLGTDTTAPYSVSWSDVPAGNYALVERQPNFRVRRHPDLRIFGSAE